MVVLRDAINSSVSRFASVVPLEDQSGENVQISRSIYSYLTFVSILIVQ